MKPITKLLTGAFCACLLAVGLTACEKEHVHAYEKAVTVPTCTEQGYTTYTCSCGESYVDDYVDELGHDFKHYISDNNATFEQNCTETAICSQRDCWETNTREIENSAIFFLFFKVENGVITGLTDYGNENCPADLVVPSTIEGEKIVGIGNDAFSGCSSLTSVTIGNGVTSIGDDAFYNCSSLTSVTIGNGVTSIGVWAFFNCSSLTSVTIPDSVTSIGDSAFGWCSSLRYNIKGELKYLGNSNNPYLYLAGTENSNIKTAMIDSNCKLIGNYAFSDCSSLTSITIPDSVTSIGKYAFSDCSSLTSVTIPDSVTSISGSAFKGCSNLTSITIPDSVTSIGYSAFEGCSGLTSISIPDSVTSIGYSAFSGCSSLTIYCEATSKPSGWNTSWNYSNCPVYWYSENQPTKTGSYWHYGENGEIVVW